MTDTVIQFDKDRHNRVLCLRRGPWANQSYALAVHFCEHPLCGCGIMDFRCVPRSEDGSQDDDTDALYFSVDVLERCLTDGPEDVRSASSRKFGEAVVAELTETDWKDLYLWLVELKQKCMEIVDLDELDAEFPDEVVVGRGAMVGYVEIFPFARGFEFEIDGEQWLADDQYCVVPDCGCTDVVLYFILVSQPSDRMRNTDKSGIACRYSYRTGEIDDALEQRLGVPSPKRLVAEMKKAHPLFDREVEKRHGTMRKLYRRALARAQEASVPYVREKAKIGRNDPCPCGSGKKYKKCCGK